MSRRVDQELWAAPGWATSADRSTRLPSRSQMIEATATVASVAHTASEITADLIAELLREQHPDLADLPLTFSARGWDNQLWRLGEDLAVRLPWATQGA